MKSDKKLADQSSTSNANPSGVIAFFQRILHRPTAAEKLAEQRKKDLEAITQYAANLKPKEQPKPPVADTTAAAPAKSNQTESANADLDDVNITIENSPTNKK